MSKTISENKEPFVRIAKRTDITGSKALLVRVVAVLLALVTGGILVLMLGHNPIEVYADMLTGSFATRTARAETIKIAIPLLGAAIAIAPAFKMKFWNIGAEGQIMAGAIAASYFALFHYDSMPKVALLVSMELLQLL
jgi:simple sugar transport system permease protein